MSGRCRHCQLYVDLLLPYVPTCVVSRSHQSCSLSSTRSLHPLSAFDFTEASAMGLVSSLMNWMLGSAGDDDKPDPATGLSLRQKNAIVNSWRMLGKKRAENGVAFFIMLFEKFPKLVTYFPQFEGKSKEELETDPTMRAHAVTVMYSIGSLVENLEDPECMVKLAEKIATNHLKRSVSLSAFDDLQEMFNDFLESRLGSSATPEVKQSWYHLLGVLNSVVRAQAAKINEKSAGVKS